MIGRECRSFADVDRRPLVYAQSDVLSVEVGSSQRCRCKVRHRHKALVGSETDVSPTMTPCPLFLTLQHPHKCVGRDNSAQDRALIKFIQQTALVSLPLPQPEYMTLGMKPSSESLKLSAPRPPHDLSLDSEQKKIRSSNLYGHKSTTAVLKLQCRSYINLNIHKGAICVVSQLVQ